MGVGLETIRARVARSIRRARLRQGITQDVLAARLGIDRSQISDWEKAKQTPRLDMAIALAGALGISVDQLLSGEEPSSDAARMADFERQLGELRAEMKGLVRRIDQGLASSRPKTRASPPRGGPASQERA